MPRFSYRAYDANGRPLDGELDAPSFADALERLTRQGLRPFETRPVSASTGRDRAPGSGRPLPHRALAQLVHELATLIAADLPLDEALRLALLNQPAGRTRAVLSTVLDEVMAGASLAAALVSTGAFPAYVSDMVRAGESTGSLANVLEELSRHLERAGELREKIASALVYPAVLMGMALIAVATILALLVPSLAGIFADANVEPPATIRFLLTLRRVLANDTLMVIAGVLAVTVALLALRRVAGVRLAASRLLLATPFAGRLITEADAALFARVLAVQLKSGVPLVSALGTAIGLVRSGAIKSTLAGLPSEVAEGSGLARPLAAAGVLPPLVVRLVKVGEETGQLERMLLHAAKVYEGKVERSLDRIVGLITPVLTILIGIGIGSLVLSVMDAVFSINEMVLR